MEHVLDEKDLSELSDDFEAMKASRAQFQRDFQLQLDYVDSGLCQRYFGDKKPQPLTQAEKLHAKLMAALNYDKIDRIKSLIEEGVDVNRREPGVPHSTAIAEAINRARYTLNEGKDAEIRLKIIELLIQGGAKINEPVIGDYTALEYALSFERPEFDTIRLLLGYGANITEKALERASKKQNKEEIMQMLNHHQEVLEKALTNPDQDLLMESIGYNKPYIMKLIVERKPELVTSSDIDLAKVTSPSLVQILRKAMEVAQLWEISSNNAIPAELAQYIEKFVEHNK